MNHLVLFLIFNLFVSCSLRAQLPDAKESAFEGTDCGQVDFADCIDEMRTKSAVSDSCRPLIEYERKNPFHWSEGRYYEHNEWKIRRALMAMGLVLDYSVAPIDFVQSKKGTHEILAVFQPANLGKHKDIGSRYSLVVFGGNLSINTCSDPGLYPWNEVILFERVAGGKNWQLMGKFKADSSVSRKRQGLDRISGWFHESVPIHCPKSTRYLKEKAGICFTHLTKGQWPEVHVWNDHLASTGILMDSYRWKHGRWIPWKVENNSSFRIEAGEVLLVHGLHANSSKWSKSEPGVEVIDPSSGSFFPSDKWVRKLLRPFKVTRLSESLETIEPGFYCFGRPAPFNGYYDDCVELVKKRKNEPDIVVDNPPEAKITFIVGTSFRHLSVKEKQMVVSELGRSLPSLSWRQEAKKFEEHPFDRYDRVLVEYTKPMEIQIGGEKHSVGKVTIPIPEMRFLDRSYKDEWGLDVGLVYVHGSEKGWSGRTKTNRPFFCNQNLGLAAHQPAIKTFCSRMSGALESNR